MNEMVTDIIGIVGVVMIIIAYFMLQSGRLSAHNIKYPIINILGSLFIIVSLYNSWNLPTFIIEIAWISISIYGIVKIRNDRKQKPKNENI